MPSRRIFTLPLALLIMPLLLCNVSSAVAATPQATILSGKVISPVTRVKPLPYNAIIDEVLVSPGQEVTEDQPLLRYHLQEETERNLQREVIMGASTEGNRSQMLTLERQLAETAAQRNKARQLAASKLGSSQALERIEGDVESLRQRIKLLKETISKQESAFKQRLAEFSDHFGTTINAGATLPHTLVLSSPMSGRVLSVASSLYPGALQPGGSAPILIGQMDPMLIQVQVYEAELGRIKEGDTASVTIPSLNDKVFAAIVAKIAWTSTDMNVAAPSYFTVELTVPNADLELKPGFKAIVRFDGAPK